MTAVDPALRARSVPQTGTTRPTLRPVIDGGRLRPLRVVMLNDVGFIGGAGVALRRQVQSLLLGGHAVSVVCWLENAVLKPRQPRGSNRPVSWLGLKAHPEIHVDKLGDVKAVADRIRDLVLESRPDIVIAGNLHWAKWPLQALRNIQAAGVPVAAYIHDCHWLTGRCAYTHGCDKFETTGCDATCPTPDEYPQLAPDLIAGAYAERRAVFTGPDRVPMVTNSRWTQGMAERAFAGQADVELLHLGLDVELFAPFDQTTARRLLGFDPDKLIVLAGSVDLSEARKGGPLLYGVLDRLADSPNIQVVGFGHNSEHIPGLHGLGNIADESLMPVLYNASDVLLNCAVEESFGQTVLEASACGTPAVALEIGGIPDIMQGDRSGILIQEPNPELFASAIIAMSEDREKARHLGEGAREHVAGRFSLEAQRDRWNDYFVRRLGFADHDQPSPDIIAYRLA